MIKLLMTIIFAVGSFGGSIIGANDALPGDMLYPIHQSLENMRLDLASSPDQAVQLRLEYAKERLTQIDKLSENGELKYVDETYADFENQINTAAYLIGQNLNTSRADAVANVLDEAFGENMPDLENDADIHDSDVLTPTE